MYEMNRRKFIRLNDTPPREGVMSDTEDKSDSEDKKVTVELKDLEPVDKETELTVDELSGVSGGLPVQTAPYSGPPPKKGGVQVPLPQGDIIKSGDGPDPWNITGTR